jgi:hypothetical protein
MGWWRGMAWIASERILIHGYFCIASESYRSIIEITQQNAILA